MLLYLRSSTLTALFVLSFSSDRKGYPHSKQLFSSKSPHFSMVIFISGTSIAASFSSSWWFVCYSVTIASLWLKSAPEKLTASFLVSNFDLCNSNHIHSCRNKYHLTKKGIDIINAIGRRGICCRIGYRGIGIGMSMGISSDGWNSEEGAVISWMPVYVSNVTVVLLGATTSAVIVMLIVVAAVVS